MHKIWENRPEALGVAEPEEITRYVPSLRGGGWGENCYRGCRDLNFSRTGWITKQAALQTEGQGLWVLRVSPRATLRSKEVHCFPSENTLELVPEIFSQVRYRRDDVFGQRLNSENRTKIKNSNKSTRRTASCSLENICRTEQPFIS